MLAEVLRATVHGGGSVSFVLPFEIEDARRFFVEQVAAGVGAGARRGVGGRHGGGAGGAADGRIVGTVQLDIATPPNQPHRADVMKLLVHPDARRHGIARALMVAVEDVARECGRSLLTLDTVTGGAAEKLYASLGYVTSGVIPGYALNCGGTAVESTTIMYKALSPNRDAAGRD